VSEYAFPRPSTPLPNGSTEWGCDGMTLRDYFAAHIAAGYIPLLTDSAIKPESVAKIAYSCATALMEERSK